MDNRMEGWMDGMGWIVIDCNQINEWMEGWDGVGWDGMR